MSKSKLPEHASIEYLKKVAKERLRELRQTDPRAKLSAAQLTVARDYGFSSWRAMKAEIDRRDPGGAAAFFDACASGDVETVRELMGENPELVRSTDKDGRTGLDGAARRGHTEVVRLLLKHGSDPNAREPGDHTYPLHWAAAHGHVEIVRAMLDAGAEVHGTEDDHALDVIGWATVFRSPGENWREIVPLLVAHGARHHIFSAIATGDPNAIRDVVQRDPRALERRASRFEEGRTALHYAISLNRYDILDLLIELGADLEAKDNNGQTAFAVATLRDDREAMRRLHASGAKEPPEWETQRSRKKEKSVLVSSFTASMAGMAGAIKKAVPMLRVADVRRTLTWYTSIGFKELARYEEEGVVNWAMVSFGRAELMLTLGGGEGPHDVSFWMYTNEIEKIHQLLKSRQLETAEATIAGDPGEHVGIPFVQDIYNPPYGGREFGIRDLNGYVLNFLQPEQSSFLQFAHDITRP
jgi:ankyrin repeat protein